MNATRKQLRYIESLRAQLTPEKIKDALSVAGIPEHRASLSKSEASALIDCFKRRIGAAPSRSEYCPDPGELAEDRWNETHGDKGGF